MKKNSKVTYDLELHKEMTLVYPIFYIPMLNKYISDPFLVVTITSVWVKDNHSYEYIPVDILDCSIHKLMNKEFTSIKVL